MDNIRIARIFSTIGDLLEINSQIHRLDLSDSHARLARARGVKLVRSFPHGVQFIALGGVTTARRAWAEPGDVLNTLPLDAFPASLRRYRVDG